MLDRREFVRGALGAATLLLLPSGRARAGLPEGAVETLEASPYVYVSPLRKDGSESTCHAEVWFAWLDGAVVVTVASDRWKARSIERGLGRARVWVGDYGRWKGVGTRNEAFRKGPTFDARATAVQDEALLDRLLAVYARKYPDEIGRWDAKMRAGHTDGSRVLIRYEPG